MIGFEERIVAHYGGADLFDQIVSALEASGVAADKLTPDHLKPVDEFHIGGAEATTALLDQLQIATGSKVLDVGSGIGGPARLMAQRYGADVCGVDLTPAFVDTARRLTDAVGLKASFVLGSALDLPFEDESFDLATLLHVGMNLPDKPRLFAEAARVIKPGGCFAVYDIMQIGAHPVFPLPWASTPEGSFLAAPADYLLAAEAAGFKLRARRDRGEAAKAFFAAMKARMAEPGPPAVGLPMVMGGDAPTKIANMVESVGAGDIVPVEMIFDKR